MGKYLMDKFVRVRCKKSYPDAHTHILIGQVLEETTRYLIVKGRAFHFKRIIDCMKNQVAAGEVMVRVMPWDNIEVIHELSSKTDYNVDFEFDPKGNLVLKDRPKTIIAKQRGNGD